MTTQWTLTLDVDWAPDYIIRSVMKKIAAAKIPCTWFLTHKSPAVDELLALDCVEPGLHPNFLPGSTHGATPKGVLQHLMTLFPGVTAVRTHSLVQSTPLLMEMIAAGITTDVSLFLPAPTPCEPHTLHLPTGSILRIPYNWEDDVAIWSAGRMPLFESTVFLSKRTIFNFHPTLIYLNAVTLDQYEAFKKAKPQTPEEAQRFISSGNGTGAFFDKLLQAYQRRKVEMQTINETAVAWRSNA